MNRLWYAAERDCGVIIQKMVKTVPQDAQDRLWKRKIGRDGDVGGVNRLRQLAQCEAITALCLALREKGRGSSVEKRNTLIGERTATSFLKFKFNLGNQFASLRCYDIALIKKGLCGARGIRVLM